MKHLTVLVALSAISLWLALSPGSAAQGGRSGGVGGAGRGTPSIRGEEKTHPAGRPSEVERPSARSLRKEAPGTRDKHTVGDLLMQNEKLSSRLQGLLPPGTNLQEASAGFEYLGQFVSAVHASHNLGIPFDQVRSRLMAGKSLGEAIHELEPGVDARKEAIRANEQALEDLEKSLPHKK